jgi:hypothetical protein
MKKLHIFLVVFVLILLNPIQVLASSLPKITESTLSASVDQVKVGETITLTAETLKQGSDFSNQWNGAIASKTYLDETTGNYVSEAKFTPNQAGTYTISYTIDMYTGNDEIKFTSSVSKSVEVISDAKEVIGLEVKNIKIYPITYPDGTIWYSILGKVYVLWNDNTSTFNRTVGYFFMPNEKSRVVNITVNLDNKEYTFPVTISINQ